MSPAFSFYFSGLIQDKCGRALYWIALASVAFVVGHVAFLLIGEQTSASFY